MKSLYKIFLFLVIFSLLFSSPFLREHFSIYATDSATQRLQELSEQIEQYQAEINRLKSQASTLSNQIAQYDAQIRLTALKIDETQEKILLLGGRIDQLEDSLVSLSRAFSSRVVHTYKMARLNEPLILLITADDLSDVVSSFHYLQKIQESDRDLLIRLEQAQVNYKDEKIDHEDLKVELDEQKAFLDSQKVVKANLLVITRNDEKKYQDLLAATRAEFEAIQAIIAGKGDEEKIGGVSAGEKIASTISGPSCNSSGGHLHFIISENGSTHSPFNYLKSGIAFEDCSGSSCGSGNGDPFNPSGSWEWPMNPTIKFTQGYGSTWAVHNTWVGKIYSFHNGIDIDGQSSGEVKAVKSGTLYRGSYTGHNGCRLRYVRVDHDDSNLDTFYLHINY